MKSRATSEGALGAPVNGSLDASRAVTGCLCCDDSVVSSKLEKEKAAVAGDDAEADVDELAATPEEGSENGSRSIVLIPVVGWQKIVVAPIYDWRRARTAQDEE